MPLFLLLLSLLLLPAASRALQPGDDDGHGDLTNQALRDKRRVEYDPEALAAAAARKRQQIEAAMSRPPLDAPLYHKALTAKTGSVFALTKDTSGERLAALGHSAAHGDKPAEPETPGASPIASFLLLVGALVLGYWWVSRRRRGTAGAKAGS